MRDALRLGIVLFILNGGCGDDGSGGPPSSGIDRTRAISSLDEADLRRLCELGNEVFYTPSLDQACTTYAALNTTDSATCEQVRSACLEADEGGGGDGDTDCSNQDVENVRGCDALVGELEDCLAEAADAYDRLFTETTCNDAGTLDDALGPTPACADLRARCPGAFVQ